MTDEFSNYRRRRVLSTLAAAGVGGLAGCPSVTVNIGDEGGDGGGSGGSDGGGDDGDDGGLLDGSDGENTGDGSGNDGDGGDGDLTCTDVTSDYVRQDVGARPFIFDFDYPAHFGELEYIQGPNAVIYQAEYPTSDGSVDLQIIQATVPGSDIGEMPEGGTSGTTTTFNGEEVEYAGISDNSDLSWVGNLPYQVDGERRLFTTGFNLTVTGEGSIECGDALREAAEHFVTSLEVNPETTIGTGG